MKLGMTDAQFKPDVSWYLIFAFCTFCDVTDDVPGVFLGDQSSSSITSDHIEKKVEKGIILMALSSKSTDMRLSSEFNP